MKISTKGQVTIPRAIREKLGLLPNTEVQFVLEGNTVRLVKVSPLDGSARGRRVVASLQGRASVGMTTEQIMALTREG